MKTTAQSRLALLAGLLLLAVIVFATGIQAAQAATVVGTGVSGSGTSSFTTPLQPQGLTAAQLHHYNRGVPPLSSVAVAQPASSSSGTSSRTAWIAAGSAAAALIIVIAAWVLVRRRQQPGERQSAAYCAQHPEDPLCTRA